MAIKTGQEYIERLKKYTPTVYMDGEKVDTICDDPRFASTIALIAKNHDFAFDADQKDLAVVTSPQVNEPVRRLTNHIQATMEDSIIKVELTRDITNRRICAWCGSNTFSLLWAVTWEIDQKYKTEYHQRFKNFHEYTQRNDLDYSWGMMDPKGNRRLRPSQQNPYPGVRIVKRDAKGITVSGCKLHTSYGPCTDYLVVVPCRAMTEDDKDFAVAFYVPIDAPGVTMITKATPNREYADLTMQCPLTGVSELK